MRIIPGENKIGHAGAEAIGKALNVLLPEALAKFGITDSSKEEINLVSKGLTDADCKWVAALMSLPTLKELDLSESIFSFVFLPFRIPYHDFIFSVCLSDTISFLNATLLLIPLSPLTLCSSSHVTLSLSDNNSIGNQGAEALARGLSGSQLKELNLCKSYPIVILGAFH